MTSTIIKPHWKIDDPARADLIDPLLADMGFDNDEVKEATRERAKEILTWGEITMGDFSAMLSEFYEGYKTCLLNCHEVCPSYKRS